MNTLTTTKSSEAERLKKALFTKLYERLNEQQRQAVFCTEGALLVLAGAGSGKTTVLVNRIAQILRFGSAYSSPLTESEKDLLLSSAPLLETGTAEQISQLLSGMAKDPPKPWEVLCLTFTNKAAGEFRERLQKMLGESADEIWAGTFHSICARILRRRADRIGMDRSFSIYDSDDSRKLIVSCMKELEIDEKLLPVQVIQREISKSKENCIDSAAFSASVGHDLRLHRICSVYELYEKRLSEANALDFDDLIFKTVKLFRKCPDVLGEYAKQFRYILADEYQDTNRSQSLLIELLGSVHKNVCVVGDDDQSIYGFRGATVENIMGFDEMFENTRTIKLEQNYRCTGNILAAANAVIAHNVNRKGKTLRTDNEDGVKVLVKRHYTQSEEATYLMNLIRHRVVYDGAKYSDFAILYRLNEQSNALELIFSKSRVPYRVYGGTRFYDRKEIKDISAYLSVISNPNDSTRLRRIINTPRRQIGPTTVAAVEKLAAEQQLPLYEVIRSASKYPELAKSLPALRAFSELIEGLRAAANNETIDSLLQLVIERTGYRNMLLLDPDEREREKVALVDEFVSTAVEFEQTAEDKSLGAFLEQIALISDVDNYDSNADAVSLMTMHSAKGLEFPVVFLPGFEEGLFPSMRATTEAQLEEERRLAYVAMTRAQKELQILHTNTRLLYGRTSSNRRSRFIDELPEENVEFSDVQKALSTIRPTDSRVRHNRSLESFEKNVHTARQTAYGDAGGISFKAGDRVSHHVFGAGTVTAAEPMGGDILYVIEFDTHGKRKLMGSFAKLEPAGQ